MYASGIIISSFVFLLILSSAFLLTINFILLLVSNESLASQFNKYKNLLSSYCVSSRILLLRNKLDRSFTNKFPVLESNQSRLFVDGVNFECVGDSIPNLYATSALLLSTIALPSIWKFILSEKYTFFPEVFNPNFFVYSLF